MKANRLRFSLFFGLFTVCSVFWLWSRTGIRDVLTVDFSSAGFSAKYNDLDLGQLTAPPGFHQRVSIDLGGDLPQPRLFSSRVVGIDVIDPFHPLGYSLCNKQCPVEFDLPGSAAKLVIKTQNAFYFRLNFSPSEPTGYYVLVRPFRERDFEVASLVEGRIVQLSSNYRQLSFPLVKSAKYCLLILLYPWPIVAPVLLLIFFISLAAIRSFPASASLRHLLSLAPVCFFLFVFLYLSYVASEYVGKIPHDPDSVEYLWAAKYLSAGRLWLPIPKYYDFFRSHQVVGQHWTILMFYGHPLFLALGGIADVYWLIPPLAGTLFLLLMYLVLKEVVNSRFVAFMSVIFIFLSPQFQMQAVNFMSHNTANLYLAVTIYGFVKFLKNKASPFLCVFSGVSFGLLAQTRPLTAIAIFPLFCLISLIFLQKKIVKLKSAMLIIAGLVFVSLVFLFINYLIYGSPLQTPNSQMNLPKFSWGGSGYTLNHGLVDAVSYLIVFSILFTCGLPAIFGLFIILPLFNFRHFWKGAICLVAILLIIVSMASYDDPWGVFLGARFWHEILPFLAVLIALSFDLFLSIDQRGIVSRLIILSLILVVGSQNFRGWIKGEKLWSGLSYFVPHQLEDLKTFNFTDTRLIRKAKELNLKHAVVFVKHCDHWWCYGSVTDENSINFDGNIVWAHDLGDQNYQLIDQFPTRSFYFADYDQGTITPYHLP